MSLVKKKATSVATEMINYAVSYLAGYSASMLVNRYFVTRKLSNLWGLTANKKVLDHDTYNATLFWSTYFFGVVIGLTVSYLIKRFITKDEELV